MLRYAVIRKQDISNGDGLRVTIFFQGCRFHCKGCWNESTWDFQGGKELTSDLIDEVIYLGKQEHISGISLLGGEPFQQDAQSLLALLIKLKEEVGKPIYLWTGYTYDKIPKTHRECLKYIDVLVDGQYIEEQANYDLKWRGSANQRILHLKKGKIKWIEQ